MVPKSAVLALGLAMALAACDSGNQEGSQGTMGSIPENQGMQGGAGVGENAPGGSEAATAAPAEPAGNPAGAAGYPATGKP